VIQSGLATWYGPGFTGGVTYCGEIYDQWAMTAASNTLPCGTVIVVTNQSTGLAVRVRITDRGGFGGSVILDLSRAAFLSIAPSSSGVIPVTVALALP
jgi:rare lipoprotein A